MAFGRRAIGGQVCATLGAVAGERARVDTVGLGLEAERADVTLDEIRRGAVDAHAPGDEKADEGRLVAPCRLADDERVRERVAAPRGKGTEEASNVRLLTSTPMQSILSMGSTSLSIVCGR